MKFFSWLQTFVCSDAYDLIKAKNELINKIGSENNTLRATIKDKEQEVQTHQLKVDELTTALNESYKDQTDNILEYFWTHKIKPRNSYLYPARNGNAMNVLQFLQINKNNVPQVLGYDADTIANNALVWVRRNIKYTKDPGEFWKYANETLQDLAGDCEDGAILMADIMISSGVPAWRVRVNVGPVKGGYHAYITYLREKENVWYVLDWCYWPNESANFGLPWKKAEGKYFDIDFSFDKNNAYVKDNLDR